MNGLELSTFCMARTERELTESDPGRQSHLVLRFSVDNG